MNRVRTDKQFVLKQLAALSIASLLAGSLISCGVKEESAPKSTEAIPPTPVFQPAETQSQTFEKYSEPAKKAAQPGGDHKTAKQPPAAAGEVPVTVSAKDYEVKLGADPVLTIPGPPGQLKVWIGLPAYAPAYPDLKTQSDTLPAEGKTAKVKPFAPGLTVKPDTSICMKTNPRGSEVRFELIPIDSGTFNVGADVVLFESGDCSGAPIPKATRTLQVAVSVDRVKVTAKYITELWDVFWSKFLKFWGEALVLFFAALLFIFRKKLKKWFGYTE